MKSYWTARTSLPRTRSTRGAFTLVEILVALSVMMLLLVIILIPVNMGLDLFHIGKARSEVQQANQLVINQLASELRQAVHVFPNENMPGITNKVPYTNNTTSPNFGPYYDSTATPNRVSNTARIDFLLPATNNGSVTNPLKATNYLVTYYARRLKPTLDDGVTNNPYNVYSNPIVLWRAQYPYREDLSGAPITAPFIAANLSTTRYSNWTVNSNKWLVQMSGEPNLSEGPPNNVDFSTQDTGSASDASHTQITPRDMVLIASSAPTNLQPDSSFICDDFNNDGKIDRVNISLLLAKYDSIGAAGENKNQQIRLTRTVELPNVK